MPACGDCPLEVAFLLLGYRAIESAAQKTRFPEPDYLVILSSRGGATPRSGDRLKEVAQARN